MGDRPTLHSTGMGRRNGKGRDEGWALEWNKEGLITQGTQVLPPDSPGIRNGLTQVPRYAWAEMRLPSGEKGDQGVALEDKIANIKAALKEFHTDL